MKFILNIINTVKGFFNSQAEIKRLGILVVNNDDLIITLKELCDDKTQEINKLDIDVDDLQESLVATREVNQSLNDSINEWINSISILERELTKSRALHQKYYGLWYYANDAKDSWKERAVLAEKIIKSNPANIVDYALSEAVSDQATDELIETIPNAVEVDKVNTYDKCKNWCNGINEVCSDCPPNVVKD